MWLLLVFVAVPILEIALFIQVGGFIGLWPTLAIVVLTAIVGTTLMRIQGLNALGRLRTRLAAGEDPVGPIADGALILVAGVLLLTPGFFTDTIGLLLLVPAVRAALIRAIAARVSLRAATVSASGVRREHYDYEARPRASEPIEADYEVLDDVPPSRRGASGWTQPRS
jgi:UPF0716 protein FxsA